jgi:Tfp pilus assembly protein PilE
MKRQLGLTLIGMILVGALVAIAAMIAIKVVPAYIEYFTIRKNIEKVVKSSDMKTASVADIRKAYEKYAQVDDTSSVSGKDLDIGKEGGEIVVGFSYAKKVNLMGNVNLCIDFEGSSGGK